MLRSLLPVLMIAGAAAVSPAFAQAPPLPGPMGGDIVRNMDVAPDGSPVMAHSLSNEVGRVEIK